MKLTEEHLKLARESADSYINSDDPIRKQAANVVIFLLDHIDVKTAEYTEELNRLSAERDIDSGLIIDLGKRLRDAEVKCEFFKRGLDEANAEIKRLEERQNVNS